MREKVNYIVLLIIMLLNYSCRKDPLAIAPQSPAFTQLLTNYDNDGEQIFVLGKVEQNELRLLNLGGMAVIDGSGQLYKNEELTFGFEIPQGIAPAENKSFIVIKDLMKPHLSFFDYDALDKFGSYAFYDLYIGQGKYNPNQFLGGIIAFNPGHEIGALNYNDVFLSPVVRMGYYHRINLISFTITGSYLLEPTSNWFIRPDSTSYHKITLPDEGDTVVNRVESFNDNFLVSTAKFSYVIHPDGTFKQIFPRSVQEFFLYNNLTYADFGDAIYSSPDDGESWTLVKSNLPNGGFRQFFTVKDSLCFFRNDSLFLVHKDFTYKTLNNNGIQGDEITSVNEFIDNVYVTTLSGLFYKKTEDLYK